jgi:hypothetical protein
MTTEERLRMGLLDRANDALEGHEKQTDAAIKKAGDVVDGKTGGKHTEQIEKGEVKADEAIGK